MLRTERNRLTNAALNTLGGLQQVLNLHATAVYQSFGDEKRDLVESALVSLG